MAGIAGLNVGHVIRVTGLRGGVGDDRGGAILQCHRDEHPAVAVVAADGHKGGAGLDQARVGGDGEDIDVERAHGERAVERGDEIA